MNTSPVESLITRWYDSLEKYAARPGANYKYIQRQNKDIDQLVDFVNALKFSEEIYAQTDLNVELAVAKHMIWEFCETLRVFTHGRITIDAMQWINAIASRATEARQWQAYITSAVAHKPAEAELPQLISQCPKLSGNEFTHHTFFGKINMIRNIAKDLKSNENARIE